MIRSIAVVLLATSFALADGPPYTVPWGTNTIGTPWWVSKPGTNALGNWEAWYTQATNWAWAQSEFGSISDAHTNSVLNSFKIQSFNTNTITVALGTTNTIPWAITNFAGCDWVTLAGDVELMLSFDAGTSWVFGNTTTITNTTCQLAFRNAQKPDIFGPVAGVLTNLVVYTLQRPDLFAKTNATYGEVFRVSYPSHKDDAASKEYVDRVMRTTYWWQAQTNVYLNSHTLYFSGAWAMDAGSTTNNDVLNVTHFGAPVMEFIQPPSVNVSNASIALAGSDYQLTIPTNGLPAEPRLVYSHFVDNPAWAWLNSTPVVSDTNYVFTFAPPYPDMSFFMALTVGAAPSAVSVSSLFKLSPRTITNATDTTFGYGPGMVCVDSNHIYISVGTNLWKRVPIAAW